MYSYRWKMELEYLKRKENCSVRKLKIMQDTSAIWTKNSTWLSPDAISHESTWSSIIANLWFPLISFYFNLRSAYAERLLKRIAEIDEILFQSTLRVCRATGHGSAAFYPSPFQSTLRVCRATANLTKLQSVFSNTFTNFLSQIYLNVILCCIFVSMKLYFLHVCRCESHCIFVCTSHSHLQTHHGVLYKINLNQWLLLNKSRWF